MFGAVFPPAVGLLVKSYREQQHPKLPTVGPDRSQPDVAGISPKQMLLVSKHMDKLRQTIEDVRKSLATIKDTEMRDHWRAEAELRRWDAFGSGRSAAPSSSSKRSRS